jgi:hypothetical protein
MRLSARLLDAVEAALPGPEAPGIATQEVHRRVGQWGRTTVRHALRALARGGRAQFTGIDRHRRYRRAGAPGSAAAPMPAPAAAEPRAEARTMLRGDPPPHNPWREYALRGDGRDQRPEDAAVAAAMRRAGIRYADVERAALSEEERRPGWAAPRPRSNAELTRLVLGDPRPGRRVPA